MRDLRHALRLLLKSPGFTLVAVATLSLGIGACTLVFSWIRTILIDTVPGARDPGNLVVLAYHHADGTIDHTLSLLDGRDLAGLTNIYDGVIASQMEATTLRIDREVEWVWTQPTTANFFEVLGVHPAVGRTFQADEDRAPGGNPVAVISHPLWLRRFGGDPAVVGRTVEVGRRPFTIIGVAPAGFRGTMGGLQFDLWIPVTMSGEFEDISRALTSRNWRWLHTIGRLRSGVSLAQAQAATTLLMRRAEQAYPDTNRDVGVAVLPVWKSPWGAQAALLPLLAALAGVAILLLFLVVANIANLLLARAISRESEMAVRIAVGAGTHHLIRQSLIESLLLAALGGVGGSLLAAVFSRSLLSFLPPTHLPIGLQFPTDARILGFTLVVTLVTGLAFGTVPAWRATRANLADTLKAGGRFGEGTRGTHRLRQLLVIGEIAAAFTLLIGMALCARSFERARALPVGLEPKGVWVAGFRLPPASYSHEEALDFYRRLRRALAELPGVQSVALTDWLPLGFEGGSSTGFQVPGYDRQPGERLSAGVSVVSPGYFATLRIPVLRGREFDERDGPKATPVIVLNEYLATRYFPGQDALGRQIEVWGRPRTIVGIAATGKYRSLNESPRAYFWLPVDQIGDHTLTAVVRTHQAAAALAGAIERTATRLDPNAKPVAGMPLPTYMAAAYLLPRTAAVLLAILGGLAVFLAALGIAATVSWSVGRRVREVGVRMALGAQRREVTWLFIRQALLLTSIGAGLGLAAALLGGRFLAGLLVEVSTMDPLAVAAAIPILAAVATLAAWLPARQAASVDPMVALRSE